MNAIVPIIHERRASVRTKVACPAVLRIDGRAEEVTLADLTRHGCRIVVDRDLPPFAAVGIGLPGVGSTPGQLIWRRDREYGCAFDTPLPPGALGAVLVSNVAYLGSGAPAAAPSPAATGRTNRRASLRTRLVVIVALTATLWSGIIGTAALLI